MNKKTIVNNIPNFITCIRIIGTLCLWFTDSFSMAFFVLYSIAGVSDALDGFVARTMKTTSEFGTKLDSVADIMFYITMTVKVFPTLWAELPLWLWICAAGVMSVRITSYTLAAVKYHCFATLHTYMNKLTGFTLFCIPYAITLAGSVQACIVLFVVSSISSVEELIIHITRREYRSNVKGILFDN